MPGNLDGPEVPDHRRLQLFTAAAAVAAEYGMAAVHESLEPQVLGQDPIFDDPSKTGPS